LFTYRLRLSLLSFPTRRSSDLVSSVCSIRIIACARPFLHGRIRQNVAPVRSGPLRRFHPGATASRECETTDRPFRKSNRWCRHWLAHPWQRAGFRYILPPLFPVSCSILFYADWLHKNSLHRHYSCALPESASVVRGCCKHS